MAGTVRGTLEGFTNQADEYQNAADIFKVIFDALEAHPGTTRIALGGGGAGTDFWDGVSPFGQQAFAVWRFNTNGNRTWPFYVMLYCASGDGTSTVAGNILEEGTALSTASAYVNLSAAVGIGGDENPWQGTTNNDGTDTVGSPRWAIPAGGTAVHVTPATNNTGAEDGVNKENTLRVFSTTQTTSENYFAADDDGLMWAVSQGVTATPGYSHGYVGMYLPGPGHTPTVPFCGFNTVATTEDLLLTDENSGILVEDGTFNVIQLSLDTSALIAGDNKKSQVVSQRPLLTSTAVGIKGILGFVPLYQKIGSVERYSINQDGSRVALGNDGTNTKAWFPWAGASVHPLRVRAKEGVSF